MKRVGKQAFIVWLASQGVGLALLLGLVHPSKVDYYTEVVGDVIAGAIMVSSAIVYLKGIFDHLHHKTTQEFELMHKLAAGGRTGQASAGTSGIHLPSARPVFGNRG